LEKNILKGFLIKANQYKSGLAMPLSTTPQPQTPIWWYERFQEKLLEAQTNAAKTELVLLGDSIMHAWEAEGADAWNKVFTDINTLNLGFAGDRTEHVLWRLENGALEHITPKVTALLIGTNNIGHRIESTEETLAGILSIIKSIKQKAPNTQILLFAVFPRSKRPTAPLRQRVNELNEQLLKTTANTDICYKDLTHLFLDERGILQDNVAPDFLHLSSKQYEKWAEYIRPIFDVLLSRA
jgi:beta-glucosidase